MRVSAAIITRDEAVALERCLAALAWCDQVVVLDQGSADATAEVCRRHGADLRQSPWLGFGRTKQRAVEACRNRWVLSVDSDEEVSAELRDAILALPDDPPEAAFAINRLSRFLGRWMRHGGWHPDWVVRLFDRERGRFDDRAVHEALVVDGATGRLPGLLRHHAYDSLEQYIAKLNRYTTDAAAELHAAGRRATPAAAVARGAATFLRMVVVQGGWRDGGQGLVLGAGSAFYVVAKYVKLWRLGAR